MIPPFDENNNLPVNIHVATIEEIKERFAINYRRIQLFEGLLKLLKDLKCAGCKVLYLDGSFITNKERPNDFDACIEGGISKEMKIRLFPTPGDGDYCAHVQKELYGGTVILANEPQKYDTKQKKYITFLDYYQFNTRTGVHKGILQINLDKEELI